MGDIRTHAHIFETTLKSVLIKELACKEDDAIFFEIGDWLTDMSQLRDPFAYYGAKIRIWRDVKKKPVHWMLSVPIVGTPANRLLVLGKVARYLDDIFGTYSKPYDAKLALWFQNLILAVGIEKFRKKEETTNVSEPFVTPQEFKAVFRKHWTQYYPHEHLDFPPWPLNKLLGERISSRIPKHTCGSRTAKQSNSNRKFYDYLEEQLLYISERLTLIERGLIQNLANKKGRDQTQFHDLLVQFGHANHVIEDFYFHSNFTEFAFLSLAKEQYPGSSKAVSLKDFDFWYWFFANYINGRRAKRVFFRRLLAPLADAKKPHRYSRTKSQTSQVIYTGSFGDTDVFHTMYDALDGLSEEMRRSEFPNIILRTISNERERRKLGDPKYRDKVRKLHLKNLEAGIYDGMISAKVRRREMHPEAGIAFKAANKIDLTVAKSHLGERGIGGLLLELANFMQIEHDASEARRKHLDSQREADKAIFSFPTDNGASAERIGSHTLLAKDSHRKSPLYNESVKLASQVSKYFVLRMADHIKQQIRTKDSRNVDWLHQLRHFLCHPDEAKSNWYKQTLKGAPTVSNACELRFLDKKEVIERVNQQNKMMLRLKYARLEGEVDQKWANIK